MVIGRRTYIRNVYRLFAGEMLTWREGQQHVRLVRTLSSDPRYHSIRRVTPETVTQLEDTMCSAMRAYLADSGQHGLTTATLLSGGVDSSVVQLILNQLANGTSLPSYSFAVEAAGFKSEFEYASESARLLNTEHTFFRVTPEVYLDKLTRAIEVLARPQLYNEGGPCRFALAEYLASESGTPDVYFEGTGADALFGLLDARQAAIYDVAGRIPGAAPIIKLAAYLWGRRYPDKAHSLGKLAKMLPRRPPSAAIEHPLNTVGIASDLELMRRAFGDPNLVGVAEERINLARRYLSSANLQENMHTVDLLCAAYEPAAIGGQFFAATRRQLVQFYLDEQVIRSVYAFAPQVRFLKGLTVKPLLKQILAQHGYHAIANRPKRGTRFTRGLLAWMQKGPLAERVRAIKRPDFLSQEEFDKLLAQPTQFLWNVLTWDIFKSNVLSQY
jgi:asparagine synthetase B (glutamine-hydrolysing)